MNGKRVEYSGSGQLPLAGEYWKLKGRFMAMTPNGLLADLAKHSIVEHEDGTITVSPSILVDNRDNRPHYEKESYHGYLERGVWREC